MSEKKDDSLELFMQVTREYKRFVDYFAGIKERVENYTREDEYISLNTRLMLLRKYSSSGDIGFPSIKKNLIQSAIYTIVLTLIMNPSFQMEQPTD